MNKCIENYKNECWEILNASKTLKKCAVDFGNVFYVLYLLFLKRY